MLTAVVAVLVLSYANPVRILLTQQRDSATAKAQIAGQTAQLAELEAQLKRWEDPAYVKAQARTQLGWVMPGETGYRVIGTDGQVVVDPGSSSSISSTSVFDQTRWWDRLASSVLAADGPTPKK